MIASRMVFSTTAGSGEVLIVALGELERAGRRANGAAAFREAVVNLARFLLPGIAFLWAVALFRAYVAKAAFTLPAVWLGVRALGIVGGAASYVAAEAFGKALLFARLPAALSAPAQRARAAELVPWGALARTGAASALASLAGVAALHGARAALPARASVLALDRLLPLGAAAVAAAVAYLALLVLADALASRGAAAAASLPPAAPPLAAGAPAQPPPP